MVLLLHHNGNERPLQRLFVNFVVLRKNVRYQSSTVTSCILTSLSLHHITHSWKIVEIYWKTPRWWKIDFWVHNWHLMPTSLLFLVDICSSTFKLMNLFTKNSLTDHTRSIYGTTFPVNSCCRILFCRQKTLYNSLHFAFGGVFYCSTYFHQYHLHSTMAKCRMICRAHLGNDYYTSHSDQSDVSIRPVFMSFPDKTKLL